MPSSPAAERHGPSALPGARRKRTRTAASIFALGIVPALLIAGCAGGPPARLYVLDADASTSDEPPEASTFAALGVSTVTLPGYARDARVPNRAEERRIRIDDQHRWAEDPDQAITRALADRLRHHADGMVLIEPWPRDFAPVARVKIDFDRLLREPSGGVDAAGQINLVSGDGRSVLAVRTFRLVRPTTSSDLSAWFESVADLVDELARTSVSALADVLGESPS